jgi:hypothetical protein
MNETQVGRGHDGRGRPRIAAPRQNVENDVGGMDPLAQRLGAGRFDFGHAVGQHGGENLDHLPVAIIGARKPATNPLQGAGQNPVLERRPIAQSARLSRQHGHVVPGIINRLAAAKAATMFADDPPVLADHDAIGVGVDVDRPTNGAGADRVLVVVEPQSSCACASCVDLLARQVFETEAGSAWKPSNRPR